LIQENNKISTSEIANKLNVTRRTIARDNENLKKSSIIRRIGSDKYGYWQIIDDE
jgi:predicted HTH transcriptional regulator